MRGKSNEEIERLLKSQDNSQKSFKEALKVRQRRVGEKMKKK